MRRYLSYFQTPTTLAKFTAASKPGGQRWAKLVIKDLIEAGWIARKKGTLHITHLGRLAYDNYLIGKDRGCI